MGTSSLLHDELGTVRLSMMAKLSETVRKLRDQGVENCCGKMRVCLGCGFHDSQALQMDLGM